MEELIINLNKLYSTVLNKVNILCEYLKSNEVPYKVGFYNNHEIKINNHFVKEIYPIPVVCIVVDNIEIDIGFDLVNNKDYIGFIELTFNKDGILNFDFSKLDEIDFEVYGYNDYIKDYYFGNIEQMKQNINKSNENKFHVGFKISSIEQSQNLLSILRSIL